VPFAAPGGNAKALRAVGLPRQMDLGKPNTILSIA
jgi:hypothetical protein